MKSKAHSAPRGHDRDDAGPRPEFSRLVEVDDIPPKGLDLSITADAAECEALGRRAGIGVQSLVGDFHLRKVKASEVAVEGRLRARVVQTCVVSLESFESDIEPHSSSLLLSRPTSLDTLTAAGDLLGTISC